MSERKEKPSSPDKRDCGEFAFFIFSVLPLPLLVERCVRVEGLIVGDQENAVVDATEKDSDRSGSSTIAIARADTSGYDHGDDLPSGFAMKNKRFTVKIYPRDTNRPRSTPDTTTTRLHERLAPS